MALSTLPQACQSGSKKRKICLPWTKPPPRARTLRSEVVRRWAPTAPCNDRRAGRGGPVRSPIAPPPGRRRLGRYYENLRCGLSQSAPEPVTLPLVALAHVREHLQQLVVAQRMTGLLENVHGDEALVRQEPEIVQIPHEVEPARRPALEQRFVEPLRLPLAALPILLDEGLQPFG